ncbi:hypothetical protein M409DRAFT_21735 [Zasmidium cellare ATCC 36951]|uniref:Rhodopsin domain-containing protein n=1 Tax=Zasmidium cellare ATCC 36951 TaxID=1080233 RepID=A0A6A6CPZ4_ZASCE|nr:uncharacterized protein M409DRAFT_21735 [Zasmidium cellare ATCC 36951]KAF2168298.1 hypothetical protein M409DRAFT_21735 [Zasmidium cellare ATCC 36951]
MGYNVAACTAMGVMFPVLGAIVLAVRTHVRWAYTKRMEIDDILIIPAFLLIIAGGVAFIYGAQTGIIGGHSIPLTTTEYSKLNKFEWAFWNGHTVTICFVKLSILFFFRRLFRGKGKRTAFDIANWSLIVFIPIWGVVFLFAQFFVCGLHPEALWTTHFWDANACINSFAMNLAASVFNWIVDLCILIEPLVMIQRLQLVNARQRLQASAVFSLSLLAVVAGLLRMITWAELNRDGHTATVYEMLGVKYPVEDLEGIITPMLFWSYVEMGVGFLVACVLPSARIFDSIMSSKTVQKIRMHLLRKTSSSSEMERTGSETNFVYKTKSSSEGSYSEPGDRSGTNELQQYDREMAVIDSLG